MKEKGRSTNFKRKKKKKNGVQRGVPLSAADTYLPKQIHYYRICKSSAVFRESNK